MDFDKTGKFKFHIANSIAGKVYKEFRVNGGGGGMGDSYSTEMQGGRVEWILDLCGVLVCQEGGLIDGVDGSIGVLWCGVWHWRFIEIISFYQVFAHPIHQLTNIICP